MPLSLTQDACYAALASRDARFDGQFFVAVSSTGIYCRPICRVRLPAQRNCQFFETAAGAESLGFRPCLRCRPELSTRWCVEHISESLAVNALRLIDQHFAQVDVLSTVCKQLGVTDRHLRRLLHDHIGVTPSQYVQTSRLLFAKQLLTDSKLPISEVAFISGFGSVRRFNDSLKTHYGFTPSNIRKHSKPTKRASSDAKVDKDTVCCRLDVIAPFDFQALLKFHRHRAVKNLEVVDESSYQRALSLRDEVSGKSCVGWYRLSAVSETQLRLEVSRSLSPCMLAVIHIARAQFDLDANPNHWLPSLKSIANSSPGLRVPGGVDGFELAVRAILGQQISVDAATTLVGRIVNKFGEKGNAGGPSRVFPTVNRIAACRLSTLGKLGVIESRARAIQCIAQSIENKELNLSVGSDIDSTRDALLQIPGIGEWTTNYLLMRALRWPDAFIHTDLGIVKAAKQLGVADIKVHAEQWRPWRAYAAMHLWQLQHSHSKEETQ